MNFITQLALSDVERKLKGKRLVTVQKLVQTWHKREERELKKILQPKRKPRLTSTRPCA